MSQKSSSGAQIYVRKRPVIDWKGAYERWKAKEKTQEDLARELNVSRRTVIRRFKRVENGS
jgi:transcriptional regulator GlxA family with amidase domain